MLLSVIIPVYCVEHTLDVCIQSVLSQDVMDMEVILIDDGSPDYCPTLCDAWAAKDERIKVIHQENGGLSDARNRGIDNACGQYITFVDSDDTLAKDTLRPLLEWMQNNSEADILEYNVRHEDSNRLPLCLENKTYPSAKDYWQETKAWNHAYAWNKIYRKTLFNNVRFKKRRLFEDILILPQLLKHQPTISTTDKGWYQYAENQAGISKQVNVSTLWQLCKAEASAAWVMRTMPWQKNGRELYYHIICRLYDILRVGIFRMKL